MFPAHILLSTQCGIPLPNEDLKSSLEDTTSGIDGTALNTDPFSTAWMCRMEVQDDVLVTRFRVPKGLEGVLTETNFCVE